MNQKSASFVGIADLARNVQVSALSKADKFAQTTADATSSMATAMTTGKGIKVQVQSLDSQNGPAIAG